MSGLIRRKEFFLSTSGNYANKQNGFRFFLSLGISEFNLAFVILWYEYYAFFDWIKRDKNLDHDTILYLSNYQPERTTCPDSIGFNDPRQCINEIGMKNRVFYKEHPTNFLRYNKSLYRSGKFRSVSFYKDMKNLSSHKIIFCPTTLNTEYVASISKEVHAIASSFIPENRGFLYEPKIQKLAKVTCYTKNWYTYLENISSYDKKGINLEKGKLKFPEIYSKYNQTIRTEPGLDLKQNMKFREELIELIAENIDKL